MMMKRTLSSRTIHSATETGEQQPLILVNFSQKLYENEKNWTVRQAIVPGAPLDPPIEGFIKTIQNEFLTVTTEAVWSESAQFTIQSSGNGNTK